MLPTKFRFIWPSDFIGGDLKKIFCCRVMVWVRHRCCFFQSNYMADSLEILFRPFENFKTMPMVFGTECAD